MEDASDVVTCPICSNELPIHKINSHIDICLRTTDDQDNGKRRRCDSGENHGDPEEGRKRKKVTLEPGDETSEPLLEPNTNNRNKSRVVGRGTQGKQQDNKRQSQFGSLRPNVKAGVSSKGNTSSKDKPHELEQSENPRKNGTRPLLPSSQPNNKKTLDPPEFRPLADRMRPKSMEDFVGQSDLFGNNRFLKKLITTGQVSSLILWGPPGSGKTTLAGIIAKKIKEHSNTKLVKLSATTSNVAEVKKVIAEAENMQRMFKRKTILFMDEIHRFNKLQQDTFLPFIENGTITLLGATTENPSFSLNSALLSRCQVISLKKHQTEDLMTILERAAESLGMVVVQDSSGSSGDIHRDAAKIEEEALQMLANFCDGDARSALNVLEMATRSCQDRSSSPGGPSPSPGKPQEKEEAEGGSGSKRGVMITTQLIKDSLQRSHLNYDRAGEEHYNCISALHKSMRGCNADASLYWLGRMLIGGENPLYVARRLIEFSSVDVGLADPSALVQAVSAYQACQFLGMPACEFNLAQCVTYLARAPKSPEIFMAYSNVKTCITEHQGPMPGVPLHLRNVSPQTLKRMGLVEERDRFRPKSFLPEGLEDASFFRS